MFEIGAKYKSKENSDEPWLLVDVFRNAIGHVYTITDIDFHDQAVMLDGKRISGYGFTRDFEPVDPPKKKRLSLVGEMHDKVMDGFGRHALCNFSIEFKDGERVHEIMAPCYAAIQHHGGEEVKRLCFSLINTKHRLDEADFKMYRTYIKYILFNSPFSSVFLKTTMRTAINHGAYVDVNRTASEIVTALIALREGMEYPARLPVFVEMLKAGYSGNTAYIVSAVVNKATNKARGYIQTRVDGGHKVLENEMDVEDLFSTFKNGISPKHLPILYNKPYSKGHSEYRVGRTIARFNVGNSFGTFIDDNLMVTEVGVGWNRDFYASKEAVMAFADAVESKLKETK